MKPTSGKNLARILGRKGWYIARTRGSHWIFRHPQFPGRVVVPIHGNQDLKPGTQADIMRAGGISEDEL